MDLQMKVDDLPSAGQTILSESFDMFPGGKGANQALASARSAAKTALVGKVGDDGMGLRILNNLKRYEVMTSGVAKSESTSTGVAVVCVDKNGENQIIVGSGANAEIDEQQVPDEILLPQNIILFQMEVPLEQNLALMVRAKKAGTKMILNLAPAKPVPEEILKIIDVLIVNEHEAAFVAKHFDISSSGKPADLAKAIAKKYQIDCIITLGEQGCVAAEKTGNTWMQGTCTHLKVEDTTGAGDCFCGTFAAGLHNGFGFSKSIQYAIAASGLSCEKKGAQSSYPYSEEIKENVESLPDIQSI